MSQPFSVAFVGAGAMAKEHARAFRDLPGIKLAGIHSRTRGKAEALASELGIPLVADSVSELAERTKADLVVVTVLEMSMRSIALDCIQRDWNVMLEKPPGMDAAQARDIDAAARSRNKRVLVGLNRRFLSSTRGALAGLEQDKGPRWIHVQDQQSLAVARSIGHPEEVVRTWMYANSIHLVDYLRAFGRGEVTNVTPVMRWNPDKPGVVLATVTFASGDSGVYEGIWDGPGPWAASVTTSGRRYEMRPLEEATLQLAGERKRTPLEVHAHDKDFKPGFRLQAEQAVEACRGRPNTMPTMAEALESMELIQKIFA
jgi:predicted dehydrogenase